MYECVMGLRKHEGQGCILADEMHVAPCSVIQETDIHFAGVWAKPYKCFVSLSVIHMRLILPFRQSA